MASKGIRERRFGALKLKSRQSFQALTLTLVNVVESEDYELHVDFLHNTVWGEDVEFLHFEEDDRYRPPSKETSLSTV